MYMKTLLAAACLAAGGATVADAAIVVSSYDFTATGFTSGPVSGALSGSLTLSFNTAPQVYTLTALSLNLAGTQYGTGNSGLYNYDDGSVAVGANASGVQGVSEASNDFVLLFNPAALASGATFYYTTAGTNGTYFAGATVVRQAAAVPEPATWAMLIVGFGVPRARARSKTTVATNSSLSRVGTLVIPYLVATARRNS